MAPYSSMNEQNQQIDHALNPYITMGIFLRALHICYNKHIYENKLHNKQAIGV